MSTFARPPTFPNRAASRPATQSHPANEHPALFLQTVLESLRIINCSVENGSLVIRLPAAPAFRQGRPYCLFPRPNTTPCSRTLSSCSFRVRRSKHRRTGNPSPPRWFDSSTRFHDSISWSLVLNSSRRGPGIIARISRRFTRANGPRETPLHSFFISMIVPGFPGLLRLPARTINAPMHAASAAIFR
jgi:hypothetical protein